MSNRFQEGIIKAEALQASLPQNPARAMQPLLLSSSNCLTMRYRTSLWTDEFSSRLKEQKLSLNIVLVARNLIIISLITYGKCTFMRSQEPSLASDARLREAGLT
jgi:hypothetical protein